MKQNERLLVYAVSGFLALILVIAVVFGNGPKRDADGAQKASVQGLTEILGRDAQRGPATGKPVDGKAIDALLGDGPSTGIATPEQIGGEHPLVARPALAADMVERALGPSRRDRTVRFVRAKAGDSLETLVRRWCGARDPFLAEAKALNEDLVVLRLGQEVAVPWVDDEHLLALLEAQQPRTLASGELPRDPGRGEPGERPGPGLRADFAPFGSSAPAEASASGVRRNYTVVAGDSLWRIAERTYGRQHADRMVQAILRANPGISETIKIGQTLVLPPVE